MHDTMSMWHKGYIDFIQVKDQKLTIQGWLANVGDQNWTYWIDTGVTISFSPTNARLDVSESYQTDAENWQYCGFDLIDLEYTNKCEFYAVDTTTGERYDIWNFTTWLENHNQQHMNLDLSAKITPQIIAVDNFYQNPDAVREFALQQEFAPDIRYHKGQRTSVRWSAPGTKEQFERLLGKRVTRWEEHTYNGVFQFCTSEDPLVYHCDPQSYAAAVYLTPNAPPQCGTSFFRSKILPEVRTLPYDNNLFQVVFQGGFYDKSKFELVDTIGNVYNRLVIWNARLIHSASEYFGTDVTNSRLFHLFFFDIEE